MRALAPTTPTYIFPAMNTLMYEHPLTAEHIRIVKDVVHYNVVGPIGKNLACGDVGLLHSTSIALDGFKSWLLILCCLLRDRGHDGVERCRQNCDRQIPFIQICVFDLDFNLRSNKFLGRPRVDLSYRFREEQCSAGRTFQVEARLSRMTRPTLFCFRDCGSLRWMRAFIWRNLCLNPRCVLPFC